MEILRGADISAKLKVQVEGLLKELGRIPQLAIVRVGESPDDISYEKGAVRKMKSFGLHVEKYVFPQDISDWEFKREFQKINENSGIDGILVLKPLPSQIVQEDIDRIIDPLKDLDGISPVNIAKVFSGDTTGYAPCTAEAAMNILKMNHISLAGKRTVVVGRSMVVGRPLAMLLLQENATVTVCHTKTMDLQDICKRSEILVTAAGSEKLINRNYVKEGAVVVDIGINVDESGHLCGDVDFEDIKDVAAKATPVPGGIGDVTTAVLARRLVSAALAQEKHRN